MKKKIFIFQIIILAAGLLPVTHVFGDSSSCSFECRFVEANGKDQMAQSKDGILNTIYVDGGYVIVFSSDQGKTCNLVAKYQPNFGDYGTSAESQSQYPTVRHLLTQNHPLNENFENKGDLSCWMAN